MLATLMHCFATLIAKSFMCSDSDVCLFWRKLGTRPALTVREDGLVRPPLRGQRQRRGCELVAPVTPVH